MKSAFLNGYLQEEVHIEQPPSFIMEGKEDKMCLLNKTLYGLKQALRALYNRIDAHLKKMGFKRSLNEATLYIKKDKSYFVIISLYVDDLLVAASNVEMLREFKKEMA